MTHPTPAQRLRKAIDRAGLLDPSAVLRAILADPVDNGLRAATYEARITNGGAPTSPQERRAENPRPQSTTRHLDHIRDLNRAGMRFLDAISELNAEVLDAGTADDWDEAVHDATMMLEPLHRTTCAGKGCACPSRFDSATDLGRNVDKPVTDATEAVADVQRIADRYLAHAPRPIDSARSDHWCRNHLAYGITRKRATRLLCDWCYNQVRDLEQLGDPVELQLDPTLWPDEPMVRANEDGRRKDLGQHRRDWLHGKGVDSTRRLRSA